MGQFCIVHALSKFTTYPQYDDNVCSKLSVPGTEQIQKLLSVGP